MITIEYAAKAAAHAEAEYAGMEPILYQIGSYGIAHTGKVELFYRTTDAVFVLSVPSGPQEFPTAESAVPAYLEAMRHLGK